MEIPPLEPLIRQQQQSHDILIAIKYIMLLICSSANKYSRYTVVCSIILQGKFLIGMKLTSTPPPPYTSTQHHPTLPPWPLPTSPPPCVLLTAIHPIYSCPTPPNPTGPTLLHRVDKIFRLSCLKQHVLGWVKKRLRSYINLF